MDLLLEDNKTRELSQAFRASVEDDIRHANRCSIRFNLILLKILFYFGQCMSIFKKNIQWHLGL